MEKLNMDDRYTTCDQSENYSASQTCCNSKKISFTYFGLALVCFLGFGLQFCYDNPGALQDRFKTDLNIPASKFSILYAVYAWPNVVLCFFGGFFLDRVFGIRWGTITYAAVVLCGQLIFAAGTYENTFWLMVLGRFVFGIGAESLVVAQKNYAVLWFKDKALSTVLALLLSFSQMSATLDNLTIGNFYKYISETTNHTGPECIGIVLCIAAMTCVVSLICAFILGYINSHAESVSERNEEKQPKMIRFVDVKNFNQGFWLIVLICSAYYVAIYSFVSLGKLYFITKYNLQPDAANTVTSLVYATSSITSPFFGILIDKTKRNKLGLIVSIIGSLLAHGLLAFTYVSPYICTFLLGISYSLLASSLWPMIAYVVSEHQYGTAYGITQALMNLNLAVNSIVSGIIADNYGYFMLELFFLVWLLISLIAAIVIWKLNLKSISKRVPE